MHRVRPDDHADFNTAARVALYASKVYVAPKDGSNVGALCRECLRAQFRTPGRREYSGDREWYAALIPAIRCPEIDTGAG
jgi:hypothetical protein